MSEIRFSSEEKGVLAHKIKEYFSKELEHEIGQFEAEFLLEFFSKEIGAYYYNRGLYDARTIFETKLESIDEAIYAIEKETNA